MTVGYPSDWPDGCPPKDAIPASGTVFRVVKTKPARTEDFRTQCELGQYPDANPCLRRGLSVLDTKEAAYHQRFLFPKLGRFIAFGDLHPAHGATKQSGRPN